MVFPAHIRKGEDGAQEIQTVAEHCRGAARYAAECLSDIGLSQSAYLSGLLHDLGKATEPFRAYITAAASGENVRRGTVVHTFAGARALLERYHGPEPATYDDITCELLAFAIGAHHGLFDCVGEKRASGFQHRLLSHDGEYRESMQSFLRGCAGQDEIDRRFTHPVGNCRKSLRSFRAGCARTPSSPNRNCPFTLGSPHGCCCRR